MRNRVTVIKHPEDDCTGSALQLSVYLAGYGNCNGGRIRLCIGKQKPDVVTRNGKFAGGYDFEGGAGFYLGIVEVGELIGVLMGQSRSLNGGKGVTVRIGEELEVITFEVVVQPVKGYRVAISHVNADGKSDVWTFTLTPPEGMVLCMALQGVAADLLFG